MNNTTQPILDFQAIKARQKATWESGDFGQIARSIENVAGEFMARQPLRRGMRVLDVACGTGNLAVIATRQTGQGRIFSRSRLLTGTAWARHSATVLIWINADRRCVIGARPD